MAVDWEREWGLYILTVVYHTVSHKTRYKKDKAMRRFYNVKEREAVLFIFSQIQVVSKRLNVWRVDKNVTFWSATAPHYRRRTVYAELNLWAVCSLLTPDTTSPKTMQKCQKKVNLQCCGGGIQYLFNFQPIVNFTFFSVELFDKYQYWRFSVMT